MAADSSVENVVGRMFKRLVLASNCRLLVVVNEVWGLITEY